MSSRPESSGTRRRRQRNRAPRARWVLLAALAILIALGVAVTVYLSPVLALIGQREEAPATQSVGPAASPPPPLDSTHRINILLLGSDNDQKFRPDAVLTQTMIVVSVDPARHQVLLLSIPRDLWVEIPGHGMAKIQAAYALGGVALARQTVEARLKIPIHFYAWVGLNGLVKVIDRLGGVDVDVLHPVIDDAYPDDLEGNPYRTKRLYLAPGPQHLDGGRTLEYVRSRHGDLLSDFGRSARQQQVLLALEQRVSTTNLLSELPALGKDLSGHLRSDLDLLRVAQLAVFARNLHGEDVRQIYLYRPLVHDAQSADGQDILIPDWPAIRARLRQLFGADLLP